MSNPLEAWFDAHHTGAGCWKWRHYFDAYHRHLQQFRGRAVHVCEIGVYSGGSLEMWHDYFGPQAVIHGVDIQPECRAYERDWCRIHIGDQGDPHFWARFREAVPVLDVVIDDGSHQPADQLLTLNALLYHLRPGGVYLCEDIHGRMNDFAADFYRLADQLNDMVPIHSPDVLAVGANEHQQLIHSLHLYPFLAVIERTARPVERFEAPRHGTEWQPFRV
jgi:hypothetical protein